MEYITTTLSNLLQQTAFLNLTFGNIVMIFVALIFLYLAIGKGFEPLLLLPISFGMLLVNIYPDIMRSIEDSSNGVGGLLHYFYLLDEWSILPSCSVQLLSSVSTALTLWLSSWDSTIRLRLLSPSSVVQTARPLSSWQVNLVRQV